MSVGGERSTRRERAVARGMQRDRNLETIARTPKITPRRQRLVSDRQNQTLFQQAVNDLLQYAPNGHINFISIDTEGSELDIIKGIDFKKFTFDVMSLLSQLFSGVISAPIGLMEYRVGVGV